MNRRIIIFIGILLLLTGQLYAQKDYESMNADELYTLAREKAFNGEREEARKLCTMALQKNPGYLEVRVLKGRTYAWDGNYPAAREEFNAVLLTDPSQVDASIALADVEYWDNHDSLTITIADGGLQKNPTNTDLLYRKARALVRLQREDEAMLVLQQAKETKVDCIECKQLRQSLHGEKFSHTLYVNVATDLFSAYYNPMYYSMLQYGKLTKYGTVIGRLNMSSRFGEFGVQPEVETYPSLWKGAYGYLGYGFSGSDLFARHRLGAEIFQSAPKSLEFSLGYRFLHFSTANQISIYTASVGWYYKSYWLNLRTYITPGSGTFSRSLYFKTRKYFKNADNYAELYAGAGFSPDIRRLQTNVGLDPGNNIYLLKSQKIGFVLQFNFRYNMMWLVEGYYANQELSFSYGEYVKNIGLTAGVKVRI